MSSHANSTGRPVLAASTLIGVGLLGVIGMAFHPQAAGPDAQARLASLAEISPLSTHVHLTMIVTVIAGWLALSYASLEWPSRGWAWFGERLYSLGAGAMIGAGLIDGFVVGEYVRRILPVTAETAESAAGVVAFAFSLNQALAGFGTIMMSCAILAWSLGFRRDAGRVAKIASLYGVLAGVVCCLAYATGALRLNVNGMMMVVVGHGLWCALVGLHLLTQGKRDR